MNQDQAETIALTALQFIVSDDRELAALTAQTGMGPADLRAGATDTGVLGALLDFILSEEKRTLALCEAYDLEPELPARARIALPGATVGVWE